MAECKDIVGEIICRKRGDTAPDKFSIIDVESLTTPKSPLDITGFQYVMTVNTERDPDPGPPVIGSVVATINGVITDALNGEVEFLWQVIDANQVPEVYWYDIQQIDTSGNIKTIAKNIYRFFQDITK